ncbi:ABC transporter family protein [Neisseria meningitidis]|nr:ABC transporter family protein [Neisseria meningitidis]
MRSAVLFIYFFLLNIFLFQPAVIHIQSNYILFMSIVSAPLPALSALIILAHYHGIAANPADIQHEFVLPHRAI